MAEERPTQSAPIVNLPARNAIPPFESLRAFDAVARLGGIRKAASALDRDHAVVSRHLRTLESWVGVPLVERTSTGIVLTEEGLRYHRQISEAIDQIAFATTDLMKRNDDGRLQIWCKPGFALHWLAGRLGTFEAANTGLEIEMRPTNASPDFTTHEADVDIRFYRTYGPPVHLPSGVRSAEITRPGIFAAASPDYLAGCGPIETPRDLLEHQLLHEEDFEAWKNWLAAHGVKGDLDLSGPRLWQGHLTLDAARHGRGIALANQLVAADDLESGRLVAIGAGNPAFKAPTQGVYLFIARADRWNAGSIRAFRRWLIEAVKAELPRAATD